MSDRGHLHQDFFGEIVQKISEYLLIFANLDGMEWIRDGLLLPILVLADDELGRLRHASIDIAEEACPSQLRRNLGMPQDIVCAGQPLGDLTREGNGGGAGGGHGKGCGRRREN